MALRVAHHDDRRPRPRHKPKSAEGALVYDALEQARIEAIGANALAGVKDNLAAVWEQTAQRKGLNRADRSRRRAARRRRRPDGARAADRRAAARRRQGPGRRPARRDRGQGGRRPRPAHRRHGRPGRLRPHRPRGGARPFHGRRPFRSARAGRRGRVRPSRASRRPPTRAKARARSSRRRATPPRTASRACARATPPRARPPSPTRTARRPPTRLDLTDGDRPARPDIKDPGKPEPRLQGLHRRSTTRSSPPRTCASPDELTRLRAYLDQQLASLSNVVSRLANRLQRKLLAQQNRSWTFDLEEGLLDVARLTRVIVDPTAAAVVQGGEGHRVPRHGGHPADRQLRLHARPADHGRGGLRRHPGADAGALLGEDRGARLHHPRLEGRRRRATPGSRRASRRRPAASTTCATSSTSRADAPWRRARKNLGLMMREGLLKENIDGEALMWAHQRLIGRTEQRRILMVISDGAPVDDSTLSVNSGHYLERHLRRVIAEIEGKIAGGADRHRHRPRRHPLLPPGGDHRRCRAARRRDHRPARRPVRGGAPGRSTRASAALLAPLPSVQGAPGPKPAAAPVHGPGVKPACVADYPSGGAGAGCRRVLFDYIDGGSYAETTLRGQRRRPRGGHPAPAGAARTSRS